MTRVSPNVVVVGSLNLDYIASVQRLPKPGETVPATGLLTRFGGKGANQAVAAARLGGKVGFISKLGRDPFGDLARQTYIRSAGSRIRATAPRAARRRLKAIS